MIQEDTTLHPLVDDFGPKWVVNSTCSPTVPTTRMRLSLFADAEAARKFVVIVGPEHGALSFSTLELLRRSHGTWVNRAGDGRFWFPAGGRMLERPQDAFAVGESSTRDVLPFAISQVAKEEHVCSAVQVNVVVHHRPNAETLLGRSVELLAAHLGDAHPRSFGIAEPSTVLWNRDALTSVARNVSPASARFVVAGSRDKQFAAVVTVRRDATGVSEETKLLFPLETANGVPQRLENAFEEIIGSQRLVSGMSWETLATPTGDIPPLHLESPVPLIGAFGPEIVRSARSGVQVAEEAGVCRLTGPSRTPSAILAFDTGENNWMAFQALINSLGRRNLVEILHSGRLAHAS